MPENPSDAMLARRVAASDAEAFRVLYERHARGIYLFAHGLLGREEATDVVQDVFMTVWQKAHQFDEERGGFRTWLTAIARHRILDLTRRRTHDVRHARASAVAEELEQLVDHVTDVAEDATVSVDGARVLAAVASLPPLQRRALALVYFGGYTHRELAEQLDWPLGTVKKRVRLGLHKLAVELGHLRPEPLTATEEAANDL